MKKHILRKYKRAIPIAAIAVLISILAPFSLRPAVAAQGDILGVRIIGEANRNGWVAEIDIDSVTTGGTYNMGITPATAGSQVDANAKVTFTVTSPGFDTSGNATTTTRTVYGTSSLRQPYPNQNSPDETTGAGFVTVRVALSEFIYAGDTVTANIGAGFYTQGGHPNSPATNYSVTNSSTNSYPKPVGRWAWAPYERVSSNFLLEASIFHRFSRNAKPLAAVKFTCTDEHSNSLSQTVNDMTVSTRTDTASTGNKVLVYATTMPIASFTQGDIITCNFTAYPWVGNAAATLNSDLVANGGDGFAQPDERLGPFEVLNDKNGTYGTPCAIVSSTGQASVATTWVYSSCAAAEAAYAGNNTLAYADIGRAAQAIRAYNNTNHGHNDPGGGTIELQAQNYTTPGTAPAGTLGAQKTWLTIQPASNVPCQTPVINANGNNDLDAQKLKYRCIATATTGTGSTFRGNTTLTDILWLDTMKLSATEGAPIRYWKTFYATGNTIDALPGGFSGVFGAATWPPSLVRGNNYTPLNTAVGAPLETTLQAVLGNKNMRIEAVYSSNAPRQISDNSVLAFNSVINSDNSTPEIWISSSSSTQFTKGIAVVQNTVEAVNSAQPIVAIENMGGSDSINNLIFWHNTTRGQRSNVAYAADSAHCTEAVPFFSNWTWKYNIESNNNRIDEDRSDHGCPADGRRIGNWSMTYMVGGAGNTLAAGNGPSWSPPDYYGLFTIGDPATEGFVNDKSSTQYGGAGGGGGNYHLTASSSMLGVVPAGQAVLPYDLEGTARYNNGFGASGVYERSDGVPTPPTVSDANISISGASGNGGTYIIGDTVTATWNNTAGGDNNSGISGVTVDFSAFGGGAAVAATQASGTWTASYTLPAGALEATGRNVSVTATNATGPTTTADTTNATVDNRAPTLASTLPADNASGIGVGSNLSMNFSEVVNAGTGNMVLRRSTDNSVVQSFNITTDVTGSGTTVITANPASDLANNTGYYVEVAATALKDVAGNAYAGVAGATAWNFTTVAHVSDTCTWTGLLSSDWSTGGNWTGCDNGGIPEPGDSLVFPDSPSNKLSNNNLSGAAYEDITISGSGYTLDGNSITVTGTLLVTGDNNTLDADVASAPIYFNDGTLVYNGQTTASFIVAGGATLKGTGTLGSTSVAGELAPGHSPGCMTVASLALTGTLTVEIDGPTACTEYDRVTVTGGANLAGGNLQLALGYIPAIGTTFTIIEAASVSGEFTGIADGSYVTANGLVFQVDYTGTTVGLTRVSELPPSTPSVEVGAEGSLAATGVDTVGTALAGLVMLAAGVLIILRQSCAGQRQ